MAGDFTKRVLRSRIGPNPQSIVGAAVGLIAAFQTWLIREGISFASPPATSPGTFPDLDWMRYILQHGELSLLDLITSDFLGVGFFCALFLFGALLSAFSPIGAIPQMVGLLGFVFNHASYHVGAPYWGVTGWSLGIGYALGMLSTFIVMQSPVRSMLAANGGKPVRMLGRFAALSPRTISSWR